MSLHRCSDCGELWHTSTMPHQCSATPSLGLVERMSYEDYHNAPGVRSSAIKTLRTSSRAAANDRPRSTDAMELGTLAHAALLEPHRFRGEYVSEPVWTFDWNKQRKESTKERAAWKEENEGLTQVPRLDWLKLEGMRKAVKEHEKASELLSARPVEVSCFWQEPGWGLAKCRLDVLDHARCRITDLKTTVDPDPRLFRNAVHKYGYALQAAWYLRGARAVGIDDVEHFTIVAVQKTAPFEVRVYSLDPEWIALGNREIDALLHRWREVQDGVPRFAQERPEMLTPPEWIEREVEELEAACATGGEEE